MPLSEFYRMAKGKVEPPQTKTPACSTDLSFGTDNELVELVWENGQIMMQGQSSRGRKSPKNSNSNNFHFHTSRFRDKDIGSESTSKMGKYGAIDSIYSDIAASVPESGMSQDDDMGPWLNYPIEDPLQQDYCPDFQHELSGVTMNEPSTRNSFASMDKRDRGNQIVRSSHSVTVHNSVSIGQNNESKLPSARYGQIYPWPLQQGQTSFPSIGSRTPDIISSNTSNARCDVPGDLVPVQGPGGSLSHMKVQKQDSGPPRSSPSLLNFSHFSRPFAAARANIQNESPVPALGSSGVDMMVSAGSCRDHTESAPLEPKSVLQREINFHTRPNLVSAKVDSKPLETKPLDESRPGKQSNTVCQEDGTKSDRSPSHALGGSTSKGVKDNAKAAEPVVASSVCSGNSAEGASNSPTVNLKRKSCRDTEESEGQSEDVEEESVGVKKATSARGGAGSKRSRAAEVHNLSERRRRDRINEKMRALQELIPNCNKVDKASMLDEAIEYLKTLQLQVQIMSMGAGLYMPPMMFPTGMQHMHAAHLPHFYPMGVGMGLGMGIGFGMNMLDMNGGSRGSSMLQVPSMHGAHFPSPPISGASNFQGMTGSNHHVFGHPSQALPISVTGTPVAPSPGRPPISSAAGMNASSMGVHVEASNAALSMNSTDLMQSTNLKVMHNADTSPSMNQKPSQFQPANEGFDPNLVQKNDRGPDVGGSAAANSTKDQ